MRRAKRIGGEGCGNKVKLSVDYVILYIGNPKDYTKMLFELINKLNTVAGYKNQYTKISHNHFQQTQREKLRKKFH